MEVAQQQIFSNKSCDVHVFVNSKDLGKVLVLLSPNNGHRFCFCLSVVGIRMFWLGMTELAYMVALSN